MALLNGFEGMKFFSLYGLLAVFIVVIPNFAFAKKGQETRPDDVDTAGAGISALELVSRLVINIVLVCMRFPVRYDAFGICAGIVLAIYFVLWARYFRQGCYYPDIYTKKFMGIPLPFDISVILYFIFVSVWLCNIVALAASVVYAFCRLINANIARKDLSSRV